MKPLLTALALLILVTAPAYAEEGELDGKGLECTHARSPLKYSPMYFHFEKAKVFQLYVDASTPLMIKRFNFSGNYETAFDVIQWGSFSVLDRKTLKLISEAGDPYNCQVRTPKEIEAILQKQIEALKEKMKDNKI